MSRDIEPDPRQEMRAERVSGGPDSRQIPLLDRPVPTRERVHVRPRSERYQLSPAELATIGDVGRFRTVEVADLARVRYPGRPGHLKRDLRSLQDQGLVQRRSAWVGGKQGKLDVLVLTERAKRILENDQPTVSAPAGVADRQAFHAGFVKPAEVAHDAAIYRMYQAEATRLERAGSTIRRVVLDYELKRRIYAPLAKCRQLPAAEYAKRQAAVAAEHGLRVVRGTIPLPDLRVEYQTREGELARVDLELATHHYHGAHLATKAEAGFTLYAAAGSAQSLSRAMEEREITASILSL